MTRSRILADTPFKIHVNGNGRDFTCHVKLVYDGPFSRVRICNNGDSKTYSGSIQKARDFYRRVCSDFAHGRYEIQEELDHVSVVPACW